MSWFSDIIPIVLSVGKKILPASPSIVGTTVTAAQLETATGSLGAFFTALNTALKAKNISTSTELAIEEVITIATELGLGEPFTGIAKIVLPLVFEQFNILATMSLVAVDGGAKGYVASNWVHDPREQIDAAGNFTD